MAVAHKGEAPIAEVAKAFGISESCLRNWLVEADAEDGLRPGVSDRFGGAAGVERRNRLREQACVPRPR